MATNKALVKQYKELVLTIASFSDGQASIAERPPEDVDSEDSMAILYINITPNDGPYKDGTFKFKLDMTEDYPDISPPKINCLTRVYHPNIDMVDEYSEGEICLNLMDELWTPELTLVEYVQGLLFMFYNPNIEDPLNPAFNGSEDMDEFEDNVRLSMRGIEIDGVEYDKVLPDDPDEVIAVATDDVTVATNTNTVSAEKESLVTKDTVSLDVDIDKSANNILVTDRDETTGQYILSPFVYRLWPITGVRPFVKDLIQYNAVYILATACLFGGLYLLRKRITR
jgi:ubiquitin-conjugating enzyme E2 M